MNKLIDNIFYILWKIFNPISFLKFTVSSNKILNRKKAYLGKDSELEKLSFKIKAELFNSKEFIQKVDEAKSSTDKFGFTFDCYNYLSQNLRDEIYTFASENNFVNTLSNRFLGIESTLNTISIYANVPRHLDSEIGSKMWHRDGNTYLAADFMFAISEINDNNGPFYWIDPVDFGSSKFYKSKNDNGWEYSGRFSDEELIKLGLNKNNIQKFIGLPGSYILLNTGESFHKGGFCKSEIRILGRFVYSSFGYSKGNIEKYNKEFPYKKGLFPLLLKLYSIHEKIYRNLNKLISQ
jgi:hypothetical protein